MKSSLARINRASNELNEQEYSLPMATNMIKWSSALHLEFSAHGNLCSIKECASSSFLYLIGASDIYCKELSYFCQREDNSLYFITCQVGGN